MLVFDVLDDGIPAIRYQYRPSLSLLYHIPSVVVYLIAITWSIDNVEP